MDYQQAYEDLRDRVIEIARLEARPTCTGRCRTYDTLSGDGRCFVDGEYCSTLAAALDRLQDWTSDVGGND